MEVGVCRNMYGGGGYRDEEGKGSKYRDVKEYI